MSAYMDLNDVPASGNRWLLTDILRNEWGFKGFVVSDAFAVASLQTHGYAKDPADAAYKAVHAGLDMDMASQTFTHNLAGLVKDGKVSEAEIDAAVLPILRVKYQLGLFDHPYVDASKVDAVLDRPEGLALERKLAGRSMVLLKNDNHTLPLSTSIKKIAVIGPLGDSTRDIEGGWTVEGLFGGGSKSHPVTVLAALKKRLPDAQITFVRRSHAHHALRVAVRSDPGQEAPAAAPPMPRSPTPSSRRTTPSPMPTWSSPSWASWPP